ncbi:MAG: bifunctional serine/threonine-protein kinase/formylglycine-generating enzyme family protein, partial [Microcoleaceae cyanobacterium MO_207.B10]|nr:bifunctional serine/threonine-protein kinase/formylglycine-generating enzyme family protein [Microcoleaceae cyanobacterium MO_207.B10]
MQPGITLRNHYRIIKSLGTGGFGDTYLALDEDLPGKPKCVVKHLKPKSSNPGILPIAQTLFEREANTLDKLGKYHQEIPQLLAHFQEEGEFYLVQQYIDGQDISKELIPGKKLSESYTIKLLKSILEVLAFVHQENVIHRDIKPQNLMRRRHDGKIVLIDFGAVKEISTLVINAAGETTVTVAVGTPGYMPSEQAIGKPKFSSDVYAVGMIGIQALTGRKPHQLPEDMRTGNILWRDKAEVSEELADIIDKMVRDHFSQRYQDATEALEAFAANIEVENESVSEFPPLITSTQTFTTVKVDGKGAIIERRQEQAEVMTENLGNGVILEMVLVPGGSFLMGSPDTEAYRRYNESPQHYVNVPTFLIGKYPVTQAQWEAIMENNPSSFIGTNFPVEKVSWNDALEFCQRLSEMTGKNYRLPSEAEWEYACRAGTTTPFYFGETITSELAN